MGILQATLSLDDFQFDTFELPESVPFGKQQLAGRHFLIGGKRVIDLLGAGDTDISWSGYFTGFQAEDRAKYLEGVLKKGKVMKLKTSSFVKDVVLVNFTYNFHFVFPISYSIQLYVLEDKTLPVNIIVPGDITDAILDSMQEALDLATLLSDGSVASQLAAAILAAQAVGSFTGGDPALIDKALAATQNTLVSVQNAINNAENGLFS